MKESDPPKNRTRDTDHQTSKQRAAAAFLPQLLTGRLTLGATGHIARLSGCAFVKKPSKHEVRQLDCEPGANICMRGWAGRQRGVLRRGAWCVVRVRGVWSVAGGGIGETRDLCFRVNMFICVIGVTCVIMATGRVGWRCAVSAGAWCVAGGKAVEAQTVWRAE